jgi:SET domain
VYDDELQLAREYFFLLYAIPQQHGVQVRPSRIPNAGQGLFVTQAVQQGAVVCEYRGVIWPNATAWRLKDKSYLTKLGDGKYVDALHCHNVLARYINDCRCKSGYNVVFCKDAVQEKADVVALRNIQPGEELYADYGRFYWVAYNLMNPTNPVR